MILIKKINLKLKSHNSKKLKNFQFYIHCKNNSNKWTNKERQKTLLFIDKIFKFVIFYKKHATKVGFFLCNEFQLKPI